MIFEEKQVDIEWLFSGNAKPGDYAKIPAFQIACQKVEFDNNEIETPAFDIAETKLYCIKNDGEKCELMFDNALFPMAIAPFKADREICFKNSFLKKYLKKVFVKSFKDVVKLPKDWKIKCNLLSSVEVFGDDRLDWFKEPKHKIAMNGETSDWWWLSDKYKEYEDGTSAFAFAISLADGSSLSTGAGDAAIVVRPRFVIGAKA